MVSPFFAMFRAICAFIRWTSPQKHLFFLLPNFPGFNCMFPLGIDNVPSHLVTLIFGLNYFNNLNLGALQHSSLINLLRGDRSFS